MDVVHIFANVLTILSLVAAISGLLTLIGRGHLTLQLTLRYILPPLSLSPSARDMALFRLLTSSPCLIVIQVNAPYALQQPCRCFPAQR